MKIEQNRWVKEKGWEVKALGALSSSADLVLVYACSSILSAQEPRDSIVKAYPHAKIIGCSTAGEIYETQVTDETLVLTAIDFERTEVRGSSINIQNSTDSYHAGRELALTLDHRGLVHAFVLSDGLKVNGSDLVRGITECLPSNVAVTGGLSGDADRFQKTLVLWGDSCDEGRISILGFYGEYLKVGYGSLGGWDPFGPDRVITKSEGNVLYELDGKNALELYKKYLGEHAAGLPATGLLFPLSLRVESDESRVVRTILAVDEANQSITFAGDVPKGQYARLMKANFDRLIDGATGAAKACSVKLGASNPELAILISCVGRKMVLKQRIEEEVEAVRDVLGKSTVLTGFYSYGEISPFTANAKCELHNQTMTITTFQEI